MMASKCLLSLALLLLLASFSQAELRIEPPVVKLGEISGGPDLKREVTLVNRGKEPLEILDIERGCSCLQALPQRRTLAPAERTTLSLKLRTLGHKNGPYAWTMRVRYRIGTQIKETPLRVEASIRNEVTLEPAELVLYVSDRLTHEIVLTDLRDTPLKVTRVHANLAGVGLEVQQAKPGQHRVKMTVEADRLAPGKHDFTLAIYTNDVSYAHLTLPVRLLRSAPVAIQAVPERIHFERDKGLRTTLIRLRTGDDKPLKVAAAECPGLRCTWAENSSGGAVLRLTAEEGKAPPTGAVLRVSFEDLPTRLEIPVVMP